MLKLKTTALLVTFALFGCQEQAEQETTDKSEQVQRVEEQSQEHVKEATMKAQPNTAPNEVTAWQTGRLEYIQLEGGFFGITTSRGEKLLPMNLPAQYRQAGAEIRFTGKKVTDVMTIQQWGTPFKIDKIEIVKEGKKPVSPSDLT